MAVMKYTAGKELTPERMAQMKARMAEATRRSYTHDPDCPLLTEEQLAEFRPVNLDMAQKRARLAEAAI